MSMPLILSNPVSEGFNPALTETIDRTARQGIAEGRITCADVLVARHGRVVYFKQHGLADPAENLPLAPNMLFRLASMSKPVTAVATLIAQEHGWLSVDDPLYKYMPEFKEMFVEEYDKNGNFLGKHPAPRPILLRDLLTHSSGLGSGEHFEFDRSQAPNLAYAMPCFAKTLLQFDPGTATAYSAFAAFDTLAHLCEAVSGLSYIDYLKKYLFDPLGMVDTGFAPNAEQAKRMVKIYATEDGKAVPVDMGSNLFASGFLKYHSGGGGLFGSTADYYRFAQMLLNGGEYGGVRILKEETVRAMAAEQVSHKLSGVDDSWTWGFGVRTILQDNGSQAPLPTGAFGWSGALGTHFWMDPKNDLTVVYMSNMETAGGSGALTAREIERDVYANLVD